MKNGIVTKPETRWVRSNEPVAVNVDKTVVMMSLSQGKYYGLEGPGGRIWALLETPQTVGTLCAELEKEFEVDPETCERDVEEFVGSLLRESLVRVVE